MTARLYPAPEPPPAKTAASRSRSPPHRNPAQPGDHAPPITRNRSSGPTCKPNTSPDNSAAPDTTETTAPAAPTRRPPPATTPTAPGAPPRPWSQTLPRTRHRRRSTAQSLPAPRHHPRRIQRTPATTPPHTPGNRHFRREPTVLAPTRGGGGRPGINKHACLIFYRPPVMLGRYADSHGRISATPPGAAVGGETADEWSGCRSRTDPDR